jgi:hypothetical protein
MSYAIPAEALDRLDTYIAEGRIIRGKWTSTDAQGRETAGLLAALDPDVIDDVTACPAEWLPPWLAHMIPLIDYYTSEVAWPRVVRRTQRVLRHIDKLTQDGSARAMWRLIDALLAMAEQHDIANVVAPVRALIARQLAGDTPTTEEWDAAQEAAVTLKHQGVWAVMEMSKDWAEDAVDAAWFATLAIAENADAARAATLEAARWVASAAVAAESAVVKAASVAYASEAAWDKIANACLTALEGELGLELQQ